MVTISTTEKECPLCGGTGFAPGYNEYGDCNNCDGKGLVPVPPPAPPVPRDYYLWLCHEGRLLRCLSTRGEREREGPEDREAEAFRALIAMIPGLPTGCYVTFHRVPPPGTQAEKEGL